MNKIILDKYLIGLEKQTDEMYNITYNTNYEKTLENIRNMIKKVSMPKRRDYELRLKQIEEEYRKDLIKEKDLKIKLNEFYKDIMQLTEDKKLIDIRDSFIYKRQTTQNFAGKKENLSFEALPENIKEKFWDFITSKKFILEVASFTEKGIKDAIEESLNYNVEFSDIIEKDDSYEIRFGTTIIGEGADYFLDCVLIVPKNKDEIEIDFLNVEEIVEAFKKKLRGKENLSFEDLPENIREKFWDFIKSKKFILEIASFINEDIQDAIKESLNYNVKFSDIIEKDDSYEIRFGTTIIGEGADYFLDCVLIVPKNKDEIEIDFLNVEEIVEAFKKNLKSSKDSIFKRMKFILDRMSEIEKLLETETEPKIIKNLEIELERLGKEYDKLSEYLDKIEGNIPLDITRGFKIGDKVRIKKSFVYNNDYINAGEEGIIVDVSKFTNNVVIKLDNDKEIKTGYQNIEKIRANQILAEEKDIWEIAEGIPLGEGYIAHKDKEKNEIYVLDKQGNEIIRVPNVFIQDMALIIEFFNVLLSKILTNINISEQNLEEIPTIPEDTEKEENIKDVSKTEMQEITQELEKQLNKEKTSKEQIEKEQTQKSENSEKLKEEDERLLELKKQIEEKKKKVEEVLTYLIESNKIVSEEEIDKYIKYGENRIFAKKRAIEDAIKVKRKILLAASDEMLDMFLEALKLNDKNKTDNMLEILFRNN